MFGDIKMKTKKKIEMIEMMTLKVVVIIISRHMRITLELENKNARDDSKRGSRVGGEMMHMLECTCQLCGTH